MQSPRASVYHTLSNSYISCILSLRMSTSLVIRDQNVKDVHYHDRNNTYPQPSRLNISSLFLFKSVRPGSIYLAGFEEPASLDEEIYLTCTALDSIPEAEITWKWNDNDVIGQTNTWINENGTINVESVLQVGAY